MLCRGPRLAACSFARGSGVLEWADAAMLFVTVLPQGHRAQRYPNRFACHAAAPGPPGGPSARARIEMTFFLRRGQTVEHPGVRRLLGSELVSKPPEAASAGGSRTPPVVLLLCRPSRGPYVLCGRVRATALEVGAGAGQSTITWELEDAEALLEFPDFLELLRVQGVAAA